MDDVEADLPTALLHLRLGKHIRVDDQGLDRPDSQLWNQVGLIVFTFLEDFLGDLEVGPNDERDDVAHCELSLQVLLLESYESGKHFHAPNFHHPQEQQIEFESAGPQFLELAVPVDDYSFEKLQREELPHEKGLLVKGVGHEGRQATALAVFLQEFDCGVENALQEAETKFGVGLYFLEGHQTHVIIFYNEFIDCDLEVLAVLLNQLFIQIVLDESPEFFHCWNEDTLKLLFLQEVVLLSLNLHVYFVLLSGLFEQLAAQHHHFQLLVDSF